MSRAIHTARWTTSELARLRLAYPVMTKAELAAAFPRHPIGSINSTANALGLKKVFGNRKWRQIARCANGTLRRHHRKQIARDHVGEQCHGCQLHAGGALGQG